MDSDLSGPDRRPAVAFASIVASAGFSFRRRREYSYQRSPKGT